MFEYSFLAKFRKKFSLESYFIKLSYLSKDSTTNYNLTFKTFKSIALSIEQYPQ